MPSQPVGQALVHILQLREPTGQIHLSDLFLRGDRPRQKVILGAATQLRHQGLVKLLDLKHLLFGDKGHFLDT